METQVKPHSIFLLTGAGISAESGLATFRDKDGLWEKYRIEDVASIDGYERDPALVLEFYNVRRGKLAGVQPNAAHFALARLEEAWAARGGDVTLVTQNIDDLHERAGSRNVIHMHGELSKARCHDCGDITVAEGDLLLDLGCEACGRLGTLRPHVVWFGETPLGMDLIAEKLMAADLFVSIGTSGAVYPAAGFVELARQQGVATLELNLEPSENAEVFSDARYGKASVVTPAWVDELLNG